MAGGERSAPAGDEAERPAGKAGDLDALAGYLRVLGNAKRLRLLQFLVEPHYIEEIASELKMARQTAQEHIQQLLDIGVVKRNRGRRDHGPVTEYVVVPQRLFAVGVQLGDLGGLEPEGGPKKRIVERTQATPGEEPAPEPAAAPGAHLLVLSGPNAGSVFPLVGSGPRWTIGREEDRDLRITHDPFVSGTHAEVQRGPTGLVLVDVYSSNGSFVNFRRLPRGGRVPIRTGDVLGIGRTLLVYQSE